MIQSVLEDAGLPYQILEYNRLQKKSRFSEIASSAIIREMLLVLASGELRPREGLEGLQDRIRKTDIDRRKKEYETFRKKPHQSTYYRALTWLCENGIVVPISEKKSKGVGFATRYRLDSNILLFRNSDGGWIPAVIFVCPERLLLLEGSEATEQNVLSLVPDSSMCEHCRKTDGCSLHETLGELSELKKVALCGTEK